LSVVEPVSGDPVLDAIAGHQLGEPLVVDLAELSSIPSVSDIP
jgi:hypothetical protein